MENTEEALSFSSHSSEDNIKDGVKIYVWINGKTASNTFQVELTSSINSYKRFKDLINYTGQLNKNTDQMKIYNDKGIELEDIDISALHNNNIVYAALNGEAFLKDNIIKQYEKIKNIFEKGADEIYEAKNLITDKIVAIKKKDLTRFKLDDIYSLSRDAQFLSTLKNKNIIKIYNHFMTNENLYIIMKEAKGGNLAQELRTKKDGLPEETCKKYFKQIYNAIKYIHNNNIIHGGLKPENLVFLDEKKTRLVLIDFKLSSLSIPVSNRDKIKITTAPYIPPETIMEVDSKRLPSYDMWGLGIVLYELKFGTVPFKGKNIDEIFNNIVNQPLTFPTKCKISETLYDLIFSLLKKNIHERIDITSPLFEQWFEDENPKLVDLKEYHGSGKYYKSSLFTDSKRRNSLNKKVGFSNEGAIPVRSNKRGKTTITKGKLNLGDNVPGYLKRTESSGKKEKKAILKK